jgi:hypothetical protein
LEEHLLCKERVRSSSLLVSTNSRRLSNVNEVGELLTANLTTELKIG